MNIVRKRREISGVAHELAPVDRLEVFISGVALL
jgi:hypothetical protein